MARPIKDLVGKQFGKLTVLQRAGQRKSGNILWLCQCDCGAILKIAGSRLLRGQKGCRICSLRKNPGESGFNKLYWYYQNNSKNRNYAFELTKEEFKYLTLQNCSYCGVGPSNIIYGSDGTISARDYGKYIYNGIDRVNNSKGYVKGNIVTCCETCNKAKYTQTESQFKSWLKRTYEYLKLNKYREDQNEDQNESK